MTSFPTAQPGSAGLLPPGTRVTLGAVLAVRRPDQTIGLPWKDNASGIRFTHDEIDTLIAAGAVIAHPGEDLPPVADTTLSLLHARRTVLHDAVVALIAAVDRVVAAAPGVHPDLEHTRAAAAHVLEDS